MMTDEQWQAVVGSAPVQAAILRRATTIAARARSLNDAEGGKAQITLERATRADGRPVVNVVSDNAAEEYGTSGTRRRRVLRRAASGG